MDNFIFGNNVTAVIFLLWHDSLRVEKVIVEVSICTKYSKRVEVNSTTVSIRGT